MTTQNQFMSPHGYNNWAQVIISNKGSFLLEGRISKYYMYPTEKRRTKVSKVFYVSNLLKGT